MPGWTVLVTGAAYLGTLFAVASWADRRRASGRSVIANGAVYALSLTVYATSWTFYGSVGRAAATGVGFLPIYLGPTVTVTLWWFVLRRMLRDSKRQKITSIADYVAARYGKSTGLGALVTLIAVVGTVPYLALQLKAVSVTYDLLRTHGTGAPADGVFPHRTALWVALLLAAFTIVFGTRHLDATERHEGMVAAIAVESVVKLVTFLAVGGYVTFGLFGGFGDLFDAAAARPDLARLFTLAPAQGYAGWFWLIVASMLAFAFLPRQFQVAVVENVDERHVRTAVWMFPLYLLLINLFVLPLALAGRLRLGATGADPDTFVLSLPLSAGQEWLALLAFLGGVSAATGMVIVETIALATMVSNSLVIPALLRVESRRGVQLRSSSGEMGGLVLGIRRVTIVAVLLLAYGYVLVAGDAPGLVSIGPGVVRRGVAVRARRPRRHDLARRHPQRRLRRARRRVRHLGVHPDAALLQPVRLAAARVAGRRAVRDRRAAAPAASRPERARRVQPRDVLEPAAQHGRLRGRQPGPPDGAHPARARLAHPRGPGPGPRGHRGTGQRVDRRAAGPARAVPRVGVGAPGPPRLPARPGRRDRLGRRHRRGRGAGPSRGDPPRGGGGHDVRAGDRRAPRRRGLPRRGRRHGHPRRGVARARRQPGPRAADPGAGGGHGRAAGGQPAPQRGGRAQGRVRLHRLARAPHPAHVGALVLRDPARQPRPPGRRSGALPAHRRRRGGAADPAHQPDARPVEAHLGGGRVPEEVDLADVVRDTVDATAALFADRGVTLATALPASVPAITGDRDRLVQVLQNLLSNAAKFCPREGGRVELALRVTDHVVQVDVRDNGPGVAASDREIIFEKFRQGTSVRAGHPGGTGLGLPISRQIVDRLGGRLWLAEPDGAGATFCFTLPAAGSPVPSAAELRREA